MAGRVVMLGSVNVDLVATVAMLPRPGETIWGSSFPHSQGGKGANQAVAAARAGADVALCGAVGTDVFGDGALAALAGEGVKTNRVARVAEPTGTALILVEESGENEIVVVAGANRHAHGRGFPWRPGDIAAAVLEVPIDAIDGFFTEARAAGAITFLNAAPVTDAAARLLPLCDVVCVNERELEPLQRSVGSAPLVVTLGSRGVRVIDAGGEFSVPGHSVEVVDTTGAGDAVCGVIAAGLAAGRPLTDAVVRANAAGAMAVGAPGARTAPTAKELDEFLSGRR